MKSHCLFGLAALFLAMGVAQADVLPASTKLSELRPGSTVRIVKPLRVCSDERIFMSKFFHSSGAVDGSPFAFGGEPLCRYLAPGTSLHIVSATFADSAIGLNFDDHYLRAITTFVDLTIRDMRRALGWGVWVESPPSAPAAANPKTCEENGDTKRVLPMGFGPPADDPCIQSNRAGPGSQAVLH